MRLLEPRGGQSPDERAAGSAHVTQIHALAHLVNGHPAGTAHLDFPLDIVLARPVKTASGAPGARGMGCSATTSEGTKGRSRVVPPIVARGCVHRLVLDFVNSGG